MLIQADARHIPLRDRCVQTVCTSPPYWGLRNYGTGRWVGGDASCKHEGDERWYTEQTAAVEGSLEAFSVDGEANSERIKKGRWREAGTCSCGAVYQDAQLGLEKTPDEYVANMVTVFREVWRVLRDDGTLWLNLGSSYASQGGPEPAQTKWQVEGASDGQNGGRSRTPGRFKHKDMVPIPWMVAMALQADGWYLRQDIIWAKPNPMPESVRDRCTKAHEYVFLLTKRQRYYYDAEAIREAAEYGYCPRTAKFHDVADAGVSGKRIKNTSTPGDGGTRNRRSVWTVNTQPYAAAHFATFPEKLVEPCILAGTKPGDLVLDPFAGSGTVGAVCRRLARRFVGVELNPVYVGLAKKRLRDTQPGLALEASA